MTQSGVSQRIRLAKMIGEWRRRHLVDGRPMTQKDLAKLLGMSQASVHRIESGNHRIEPATVRNLINALGIPDEPARQMLDLAAFNAVSEPWSGDRAYVPAYFRRYLEKEEVAQAIFSWHEGRLPGPLHSDFFMLWFYRAHVEQQVDVKPQIANTQRRRRLFHQPHLRRYECVLGEEGLRRIAASVKPIVICDQIDHLLDINDLDRGHPIADDRTLVRILPIETSLGYVDNDFSVLQFAEQEKGAVYIEHVLGGSYKEGREIAKQAMASWRLIADAALDRDGTNAFLRKMRGEFTVG